MKFKAFLTDNGVTLLEKKFIPAIEKLGKLCHVYLTPHHTFFLLNLLSSSDGLQSIAQFRRDSLFSDYRISSQNDNRIAFSLDLSLLVRALRSAAAISAAASDHRLQIKLVKKLPPNCTNPMPFLTFETKGYSSAVIQDIPISKPLSRTELIELQSALEDAQELPRTLVGVGDLGQLFNVVERMKQLGDVMEVLIGSNGELGLKVGNSLVTIGAELKGLKVVGETDGDGGGGLSVKVGMKHFVKCLQCHLAKPDCAFYGVGALGGSLTVVFQFFVAGSSLTDKSVSFHCRLPVLDSGS